MTTPFHTQERSARNGIIALLLGLTIFRLWFATTLDLLPDETYYFLWSKHLDASYYSKGPGIAWTIALGTALVGDTVLGIRWIAVVLAAGTGFVWWRLGETLFGGAAGRRVVLIALGMPLLAVGSVLMTIDPLSMFFWACAALHFWNIAAKDPSTTRGPSVVGEWMGLGLIIGLGFLCKFVNALQWLAFVIFLACDPTRRRWLIRPAFGASVMTFALCTIPVFLWNARHGWITATHLKERGKVESHFSFHPEKFFDFFVQQGLAWSPLLFLFLLIVAIEGLTQWKKLDAARRYVLSLFWAVFGFYVILALNDRGEANWTATSLIGGVIWLSVRWGEWASRFVWVRVLGISAWSLGLLLTVIMHSTSLLPFPPKIDPLNRARGWSELGERAAPYHAAYPRAPLVGNNYQVCSVLSFYLPGRPTTYMPPSDHIQNQFSFWPQFDPERDSEILYVTNDPNSNPALSEVNLARYYPEHALLGEIPIVRRGKVIRAFRIYRFWREAANPTAPGRG